MEIKMIINNNFSNNMLINKNSVFRNKENHIKIRDIKEKMLQFLIVWKVQPIRKLLI